MAYMAQDKTAAVRAKGQSKDRGPVKTNGVQETGGYANGNATLTHPKTHAPTLLGPNTVSKGKIATNGIVPNSPVGSGGTFDDMQDPAPGVNFGAFKTAAGKAKSNLSSKTNSKSVSESDGSFKGADTGKNRATATTNPYHLARSYQKKGAHGSHKTSL